MPFYCLGGREQDSDLRSGSAHALDPTFANFRILKLNDTAGNEFKANGIMKINCKRGCGSSSQPRKNMWPLLEWPTWWQLSIPVYDSVCSYKAKLLSMHMHCSHVPQEQTTRDHCKMSCLIGSGGSCYGKPRVIVPVSSFV